MTQDPPSVPAGLAAFLSGLVDYAGLFPPARLPLSEAAPNYAAYLRSPDAWMLGRFICPAARLADLAAYRDLFSPDAPFAVSALATGGPDAEALLAAFEADLAAVAAFEAEHAGSARADVVEVRLPDSVVEGGRERVAPLLDRLAAQVGAAGLSPERVYVELGFAGDWRSTGGEGIAALAAPRALPLGLKVRCGGLTPDAFPTAEQLAYVIAQCQARGVPFKATAGLHHPFRHHDRELEVTRHGFVNVFGAAVLAHALELTEPALRQVLRAEQPRAFTFDQEGFAFQDLQISAEQVARARHDLAHSYGSCSFDEPRDDLRALGLL